MKNNYIETILIGPFNWIGTNNNVFSSPEAIKNGVYLYTAKTKKGFLCYYVGETNRPFIERLAEHMKEHLSGKYEILDAKKFISGEIKAIFSGTYLRSKEKN